MPCQFDVFLCHNSQDKTEVIKIARQLKEEGLKPWLDEWELRPGLSWQELLEEQIKQIKSAAVFVGVSGLGPWQKREMRAFLSEFVNRGCPVIPVLLSNAHQKPELPIFLKAMTWVDFRRSHPEPMKQLIWGITGVKPRAETVANEPSKPPIKDKEKKADSPPKKQLQSDQIKLKSEKGVDYTRLRDLLAGKKWLEADQETIKVMLKATEKEGSLSSADLKKLPCEDLDIIAQLWQKYSQGHFGFLIQARLYQQERKDYYNFCTRVGWRVGDRWIGYNDLNWTLNAHPGHLPHLQGRMLYPTEGRMTDFHLNSWALELGDKFYGFGESFGLIGDPVISAIAQRLKECDIL